MKIAQIILLNPIIETALNNMKEEKISRSHIRVCLMLKENGKLFIGKDRRFPVPYNSMQQLEDDLYVLKRFGYIKEIKRILCSEVFEILVNIDFINSKTAKIIKLNTSKKAA